MSKTKKRNTKNNSERDSKARTASAAVFFNENKSIAGFGNSLRAVFTSVRELVENSLDAAENKGVTPNISIKLRRLNKQELIELMGTNIIKIDDKKIDFIELTCKDNGVGVPKSLIPQLFGTVLAGTKYGVQQARGRFGLGSKMVLLYAMSTLDLPIQITTRHEKDNLTHRVKLFIDLEKNQPIIHSEEQFEPGSNEYFENTGTEIKVSFTGSWNMAKLYVKEYFKQLAIITPYADLFIDLPPDNDIHEPLIFQRVVDDIPNPPKVVNNHPWGTDISTFRREINNSNDTNLIRFLTKNFMGVSDKSAKSFFDEVKVSTEKSPKALTSQEIRRIVHDGFSRALKEARDPSINVKDRIFGFKPPTGDSLSPLGAERLKKGLEKELTPEFVHAITRDPKAYEGHPFIIEAAIGYGGGVNKAAQSKGVTIVDNRIIYRFANRIPLIFGAGSDLITNMVNTINWSDYGLTRGTEPLAIAVSLVSTKIPFPETSKEYIDKVDEIGAEVRLTLMQLGRNLKRFLSGRKRRQRERNRKSQFEKYAPRTINNLLTILDKEGLRNSTLDVTENRFISALASGKSKTGHQKLPKGQPIFLAPIWYREDTINKLNENDIFDLASFLQYNNSQLSKIIEISALEVDIIKRRTISELDKSSLIPDITPDMLIPSNIESRFSRRDDKEKVVFLPKLNKSLHRRWIRSIYDYLVSPTSQLKKVDGLIIKLIEKDRIAILDNMHQSIINVNSSVSDSNSLSIVPIQENNLKNTNLTNSNVFQIDLSKTFIHFAELNEDPLIAKFKFKTLTQFLFATTHPSKPLNEKILSQILIPNFQETLKELISKNKQIKLLKLTNTDQNWIDGYLRNAFKRRNIHQIADLVKYPQDQLTEIGELQRTLFNAYILFLLQNQTSFSNENFITYYHKEKIKAFKKINITNFEQLASTNSIDIYLNKNAEDYIELLVKETKENLTNILEKSQKLGSLKMLKQINEHIEKEFKNLKITNTISLLKSSSNIYPKKLQKHIFKYKLLLGTQFNNFNNKIIKILKEYDIHILEEIVLSPEYFTNLKFQHDHLQSIKDFFDIIFSPIIFISTILSNSYYVLYNCGVTNIGKFLIWETQELSKITQLPVNVIDDLKNNFNETTFKSNLAKFKIKLTQLTNVYSLIELEFLEKIKFDSLSHAISIKWGDTSSFIASQNNVLKQYDDILTQPINQLHHFISNKKLAKKMSSIFKDLEIHHDIFSLLQLLINPIDQIIVKLKNKRDQTNLSNFISHLYSSKISEFEFKSVIIESVLIFKIIKKLDSPISAFEDLGKNTISILHDLNIKNIKSLFSYNFEELSNVLNLDINVFTKNILLSKFQDEGTPLYFKDDSNTINSKIKFTRDGKQFLKSEEVIALYNAGIRSIEELYYLTDHDTFDVTLTDKSGKHLFSWELINHLKKLLDSPPVIISWKNSFKPKTDEETQLSEVYNHSTDFYETFSSSELREMSNIGITKVYDFLTSHPSKISDCLDWSLEKSTNRLNSVILQEAGILLSDLEIFNDEHLSHLNELDIITIEDLYFSTRKDNWISTEINWNSIEIFKNLLHLSIHNFSNKFGQEIVDSLTNNQINTILEFILTADQILQQRTNLPAERFENLKFSLKFTPLIETFCSSIFFTPKLNYIECKLLFENNIKTIVEFIFTDINILSNLLNKNTNELINLISSIDQESITLCLQNRSIELKNIDILSSTDRKLLKQSNVYSAGSLLTLQDLIFNYHSLAEPAPPHLLDIIDQIQYICSLPLSQFPDLNTHDVEILNNNDIFSISDLLFTYNNTSTQTSNIPLLDSINSTKNAIGNLTHLISMRLLPSHVVLDEFSKDQNLLTCWMQYSDTIDPKIVQNIRKTLSLNIKHTTFYDPKVLDQVKLPNLSIAKFIIQNTMLSHHGKYLSNSLLTSIEKPGSLIDISDQGATPITLLDIDLVSFRSLLRMNIFTIEKLVYADVKELSKSTPQSQKYWKEIIKSFNPNEFNDKLKKIGIPIDILDISYLPKINWEKLGILYFDQIIDLQNSNKIPPLLLNFLYSPPIYFINNPKERTLVENSGAINILEAIHVFRSNKISYNLINNIISKSWDNFNQNWIRSPIKSNIHNINSLQELCQKYVISYNSLTFNQKRLAKLLMKSSPDLKVKIFTDSESVNNNLNIIENITNSGKLGPNNFIAKIKNFNNNNFV